MRIATALYRSGQDFLITNLDGSLAFREARGHMQNDGRAELYTDATMFSDFAVVENADRKDSR